MISRSRRLCFSGALVVLSSGCATARIVGPDQVAAVVQVNLVEDSVENPIGSGTVIDPRGYVLTAFHVVGWPTLDIQRNPDDRDHVEVSFTNSARERPSRKFRASVIRADEGIDLALLHIDSDEKGNALAKGQRFPAIAVESSPLDVDAPVVALGYAPPFDTVTVTRGSVSGLSPNARGALAWLRSDATFEPGMSGGAVVDERGKLVGVPLRLQGTTMEGATFISLARPVERVPPEWFDAIAKGVVQPATLPSNLLSVDKPETDTLVGDDIDMNEAGEERFVRTPVGVGGVVRVSPANTELTVLDPDGYTELREGLGEVEVLPDEDLRAWVRAVVPSDAKTPVPIRITFAPNAHATDPLPVSTLSVTVADTDGRSATGHILLAAKDTPAFDWVTAWRDGRIKEEELRAKGATPALYKTGVATPFPGCVIGRVYVFAVLPDSGQGLTETVRVRTSTQEQTINF